MARAGGGLVGGALVLVAMTAGLIWLRPHGVGATGLVGHAAPDITVQEHSGTTVALTSLRGTPVVVNFWASWCTSCQAEEAVLNQVSTTTTGVHFLGVDIQDSASSAWAFESAHPHAYPVGPAVDGSYLRFGVTGPPETFVLDRRGTVVAHVVGPIQSAMLTADLRRAE